MNMPKLTPEAIRIIEAHERKCDGVLKKAYAKQLARGQEVVFNRTPLDEVIGREGLSGVDRDSKEAAALEAKLAEEWKIRRSAIDMALEFIFADGPRPDKVVRRVYCLVKAIRSDLILDMSYDELSILCGESKGTQHWRFGEVITRTLKAAGFLGIAFPHQKEFGASEKYAEAQKGNKNRKGGKKTDKYANHEH